ncbi:MAG: hypothetical protein ACI8R8_002590, partial [Paraglaciecola sp.]
TSNQPYIGVSFLYGDHWVTDSLTPLPIHI